ncbi:MAG: NAD(P)-binding domain-containing protein, partial [Paludibacteraceae bacterium]|nr:NAD(P)-binding domain-containing protein [Paludibacteraceae bacterium]
MKIGIIGAGNIGGSIIEGFAQCASISNTDLYVSDLADERLQKLKQKFTGINVSTSNKEVAQESDMLIL